jgi:hypothetical protein
VDNRAQLLKCYLFGHNLIGFTHGSEEKCVRGSRCFSANPEHTSGVRNMATRVSGPPSLDRLHALQYQLLRPFHTVL